MVYYGIKNIPGLRPTKIKTFCWDIWLKTIIINFSDMKRCAETMQVLGQRNCESCVEIISDERNVRFVYVRVILVSRKINYDIHMLKML